VRGWRASGYNIPIPPGIAMKKPGTPRSKPGYKVVLRIKVLMAERDIASVDELHRRLISHGVDISYSQLARVVANTGKRLNTDLLEGLANVFDCPVRELFGG
jgi:hypothetical protein